MSTQRFTVENGGPHTPGNSMSYQYEANINCIKFINEQDPFYNVVIPGNFIGQEVLVVFGNGVNWLGPVIPPRNPVYRILWDNGITKKHIELKSQREIKNTYEDLYHQEYVSRKYWRKLYNDTNYADIRVVAVYKEEDPLSIEYLLEIRRKSKTNKEYIHKVYIDLESFNENTANAIVEKIEKLKKFF